MFGEEGRIGVRGFSVRASCISCGCTPPFHYWLEGGGASLERKQIKVMPGSHTQVRGMLLIFFPPLGRYRPQSTQPSTLRGLGVPNSHLRPGARDLNVRCNSKAAGLGLDERCNGRAAGPGLDERCRRQVPVSTNPGPATPGQATPGQASPAQATGQAKPDQPNPGQPRPGHRPGQASPAQPSPRQPRAGGGQSPSRELTVPWRGGLSVLQV